MCFLNGINFLSKHMKNFGEIPHGDIDEKDIGS